jgi:hypothetical protein
MGIIEKPALDFDLTKSVPLAPDAKATRAERRAAIDTALLADPSRSDREIAQAVGCDHKTVRTRRGEIRNSPAPGNSPPEAVVGKFDEPNSPPEVRNSLPAKDGEEFSWDDNDDQVVLRQQQATAVYRNSAGDLVIRQQNWPDDEDSMIIIAAQCEGAFIDQLCDALGIGSAGR